METGRRGGSRSSGRRLERSPRPGERANERADEGASERYPRDESHIVLGLFLSLTGRQTRSLAP